MLRKANQGQFGRSGSNTGLNDKKGSLLSGWTGMVIFFLIILIPWAFFANYHPRFNKALDGSLTLQPDHKAALDSPHNSLGQLSDSHQTISILKEAMDIHSNIHNNGQHIVDKDVLIIKPSPSGLLKIPKTIMPVLGPVPTNGAIPLYDIKHTGGDAIFALACNYPKKYYERFVGSLRKFKYDGDIVLAVSLPEKMKPGVADYIKKMNVVGYGFDVDCVGKDNCKLKDDFLGYPDPRPYRTFANIRYALYEYWLRYYTDQSYILILDFRDTFFQANPFGLLPPIGQRTPHFDLRLYAENYKIKNIGLCVYNSLWIGRCFGKPALAEIKHQAVICSGSTYGSMESIQFYTRTMLTSMDTVKCWLKGIESDQGYQNYLFYNGHFNTLSGNATLFYQGDDVVNTIGAMNGFRVPKDKKGPLDTFWKIRDSDGFILNNDGTKSACVHQWDRWYKDLHKFVDSKLYD